MAAAASDYGATSRPAPDANPQQRASRSARATAGAGLVALALVAVASRSSRAPSARAELRRADGVYSSGATYYGPDGEKAYAAQPLGDDLVQRNWPGLQCVMDDDDAWDWGADDSVMGCVAGDSFTCLTYAMTAYESRFCNNSCNATDERVINQTELNASLTIDELGGMVGARASSPCARGR